MKKFVIIITIVILSTIAVFCFYFLIIQQLEIVKKNQNKITRECLTDDEFVDYYPYLPVALEPVTISVKDKNTNQEKFSFQIKNVRETYYTIQPRKCGVYVIREFNYDPKKIKQNPGHKTELWKYTYDGNGESMLLFHEKTDENIYKSYFATNFRIDPLERYLVLKKGYFGSDDYVLVFKNLKNREDAFILWFKDIIAEHPSFIGSIGSNLIKWTKNGRYFWGNFSAIGVVFGFFRIDIENWKVEVFESPGGIFGSSAFNIEKGYVTRHPSQVGGVLDDVARKQIKKEWREQGKISSLYLYNLFTEEQILLATTDEPLWFFQPQWLSDTELEYELPTGEKKIYKIEE